jgi:Pyruvate/2-oxoacid:ferredoxin oxidoreductase gamma subunit
MVALGAYLGATRAVLLETINHLLAETFGHKPKVVDINLRALKRGHDAAQRPA